MSFESKGNRSQADYQSWAMAHLEPEQSKSGRFLTLSILVHASLILAAGMMAVPLDEKIQPETITFEIAGSSQTLEQAQGTPSAAAAPPVEEIAEALPAEIPPQTTDIPEEEAVIVQPRKAARPPAPAVKTQKLAEIVREEIKKPAPITPPTKSVAVTNPVKVGPPAAAQVATIDDIEAPEVDTTSEDIPHAAAPVAYNEDLDEDLRNVDEKQEHALVAEKNKLDQEADALDAENEEALERANAAQLEKAAAVEAANAARRERDNQAIAAAAAQEEAAREAASKQRAAAIAAAAAAQQAKQRENAKGAGDGEGETQSGIPNGVRSLDQLRQMPGNPIPQYSNQERLQNQMGQVTYYAYVKKDGFLTGFRQINSTGYANLDSKTLAALQKWRFYPGQEGWVELPFSWDLKGGAQSVDGLLRTKSSDVYRQ